MFKENDIEILVKLVGLMLFVIILDILFLKFLIIMEIDVVVVKDLVKIVDIDYEMYGLVMFKVGINFDSKIEKELIDVDVKLFEMVGKIVCVV